MAGVTHPFVSAVTDDNTPSGAVGPDEWNASHSVDLSLLDLNDVPATYVGQGGKVVQVNVSENGLSFASVSSALSVNYDPKIAPNSPSAYDDEFDDSSLAGAWTTGATGVGASGTVDETLRLGFVRIPCQDGGAGSTRFIYKAYTPGATAFTIAARVFFDVRDAGSNQVFMFAADSSGTLIYGVGMVNGHAAIFYDSSFGTVDISYLTSNAGEIYFRITRDATTNYTSYVSGDGMTWQRLSGASRVGTVARIYLQTTSFSASFAEGWWDFMRTFASITTNIGGTP